MDITISLPQTTYHRLAKWAAFNQQDVATTIAEYLTQTVPPWEATPIPPANPDTAVARERTAYLQLFPMLQQTHAGQFVAIYGGQLVDTDSDETALFARIDDQYPNEFVWLAKVEATAEPDIFLRTSLWSHWMRPG
jgi:hypothetical protein